MKRERWLYVILPWFLAIIVGLSWVAEGVGKAVLDPYGYDYDMRVFKGLYENADRDVTNNIGDQTTLHMEWDSLFNPTEPEFSGEGAWVTNRQNGLYVAPNEKMYRWHYSVKMQYTGPGSPLWGYFTMIEEQYFDGGTSVPPRHKPVVLPVSK